MEDGIIVIESFNYVMLLLLVFCRFYVLCIGSCLNLVFLFVCLYVYDLELVKVNEELLFCEKILMSGNVIIVISLIINFLFFW